MPKKDSHDPKTLFPAQLQFFSTKEVAIILGTTTKTVSQWINEGKLRAFKAKDKTRLTRIRRQDLDAFIDAHMRSGS
jgi:excisionase family DNA binding protein